MTLAGLAFGGGVLAGSLAGAIDPRRIPLWTAVPVDANLDSAALVVQPPGALVVTWDRAERRGIAVWQLDSIETAKWHRVYTREES